MKRIPRELFDMACEELMPIYESNVDESHHKRDLRFGCFLVNNVVASPVTKTLLTFAAGSFPKVVTIYIERRRKRNLKTSLIVEKTRKMPDSLYGARLQGITVDVFIKPCTRLSNDEYNYRDSLQARAIEGIGHCARFHQH